MLQILIIDDESYVCDALRRVLQASGHCVATTGTAEQGLQRLQEARTDLVIIDIVMPTMDGVAAIAQIRDQFPDVRMIAMTGGGNFGLSEYRPETIITHAYLGAARKAGAHGVLFKPFETRQLRELIDQVCGSACAVAPQ